MDLTNGTREELIAIIAAQQELIAQLQAKVRELEARLGKGGPKGMPGLKPASAKRSKPKKTRKARQKGFSRVRSKPTAQVTHVVDSCPTCHTHLSGGSVKRRREVIEIPIQPVQVIEHVFVERTCPLCQECLVPRDVLGDVVVGAQRLGHNVTSLIATLREEGRWPIRMIQWYLETIHQLHLSVGAIVEVVKRVAEAGRATVREIRERIRASEVVMADETGWREDGTNGYVWTFSTKQERYFLRRGRGKVVVEEVLGDTFRGVLVSDFYAAYNQYEGVHQRCWAHLLRDVHELKEMYPEDKGLHEWAEGIHQVYQQATEYESSDERERLRAQQHFEATIMERCRPYLKDKEAVQRRLSQRIQRFLPELFVFVANPLVPADNNEAERSLRPLVTCRKISGGTRSSKGSDTKIILASLFGTWRVRGFNPFVACRGLVSST
jgi:transposase